MIEIDGMKVYTLTEASKIMGMNKVTIRKYIHAGKLKAKMIGRKWWIPEKSIKDFFSIDEGDQHA